MIRRPPIALVSLALAAVLVTGCGTFSRSGSAAKVAETELSIDELGAVAVELGGADEAGEMTGELARGVLTGWVQSQLLLDGLAAQGVVIDQAQLDQAAADLEASNPQEWATLSPVTQRFLVDARVAEQAVVSDSQLQALYDQGAPVTNVLCPRVIVAADQETADEIASALADGVEFAEVADQNPPPGSDPATNPPGGAFVNAETGSACIATDNLAPELAQALEGVPINEPTAPIAFQDAFIFLLQRPFDEVAADVRTLLAPGIAESQRAELLAGGEAWVASRYGMWDPVTAVVVPIG